MPGDQTGCRGEEGITRMTATRRDLWTLMFGMAALASLATLSFVATPVKFVAQDVPIAHLLAVGRVTFRASLALEVILIVSLLVTAEKQSRYLTCFAASVLAFQWIVLMPGLDERTLARMAGTPLTQSSLHHWWIMLDIARLAIYALIVGIAARQIARPNI